MKFGKKRSPEPEPIDITERLSILDLRQSVRQGAAEAVNPATVVAAATPTLRAAETSVPAPMDLPAAPQQPPAAEPSSVAPAPVAGAPVVPEPIVAEQPAETPAPPVPEPAAPVPASGWGMPHSAPEPVATQHQAPDPVAYEMAAFELNLPPAAHSEPVPSETAHAQPVPVEPLPVEPLVENVVAEAPAPPAWSYEQVSRIEDAEQHVSAWVPPQPVAEHEPEPVAENAPESVEEHAPEPESVEEHAPEPIAAAVPDQRTDEVAATVDLSEPAPAVDLSEHDPVYAAVEAAQPRERGDDEVIRWHW